MAQLVWTIISNFTNARDELTSTIDSNRQSLKRYHIGGQYNLQIGCLCSQQFDIAMMNGQWPLLLIVLPLRHLHCQCITKRSSFFSIEVIVATPSSFCSISNPVYLAFFIHFHQNETFLQPTARICESTWRAKARSKPFATVAPPDFSDTNDQVLSGLI